MRRFFFFIVCVHRDAVVPGLHRAGGDSTLAGLQAFHVCLSFFDRRQVSTAVVHL